VGRKYSTPDPTQYIQLNGPGSEKTQEAAIDLGFSAQAAGEGSDAQEIGSKHGGQDRAAEPEERSLSGKCFSEQREDTQNT